MISRDSNGIPIRYRFEDGSIDYTDNAFLTGMLGLFGSKQEDQIRHLDENLMLVRNPHGDEWSSSCLNTSRDQLVAWASVKGLGVVGLVMLQYAEHWFINKDILMPHVRLYLYRQAWVKAPLWLKALGYPMMFLDIIFFCLTSNMKKVEDQHEINQMLCLCNSYGRWALKLFFKLHKSPDENMKDYFCNWRNQCEIYEMYLNWRKGLNL